MKFKILVVAFLFTTIGSYAQLLQWNTFGNTGTETTEASVFNDPNIAAASLTQGTITAVANGNRFGGSGWFNTGNTAGGNTLAEAIAGNDYLQFTVSPNAGFSFTATSFIFTWDRSGTGPQNVTLRSSLDGYVSDLGTISGIIVSAFTSNTISISGVTNITTPVTFRLYGYGATATGGTGGFDANASAVNVELAGTTAPTGPCTVPLNQASGVAFSNPSINGASISWANGAATSGSMVVIRPTAAAILDPSTSTTYIPNANYATAGQIDVDNRVVFLGSGTSVNVTGLNPQTQYTATVYSYNALDCYNTTAPVSVNFYTLSTEPTAHPASFTCAVGTPNTSVINLTFPAPNTVGAVGYLILYRIGAAAPTGVPTDGAYHAPGTVFGDAIVLGQTANTGVTTTYAATGLNSGTQYFFSLVPYNAAGLTQGTYNYRTSATILTSTCTTNVAAPLITLANNGTQVTAASVPQGTSNLILHKFQLSIATANAILQGIANVTTTGTYLATDIVNLKVRYSVDNVLDAGDVTLSTLTNPGTAGLKTFPGFTNQTIIAGTTGYVFITADVAATATINNTISLNAVAIANTIFASGGKGGTTTNGGVQTIAPSAPAVPATFTRGCVSNDSVVLNWSPPTTGTFDGYILVVREAAAPNAVTSIVASSQTFSLDYTIAPTYNATTSKVLYIGNATTATITGLTQGVSYTFALHAYKNNGPSASVYSIATTTTQIINLSNVSAAGSTPANASGTVTWTNPNAACYDEILVVATTAPGITFAPTGNGSAYVPNTVYAGANSIVYNGAGNFVVVTGLTNGVTYYLEIFVRKGTQWSSGVEVSLTPNLATVFKPGELVFVGFDGQFLNGGSQDQYMVATMVDILPNTTFSIVNSRYEAGAAANVRTDKWGGAGNDPSATPGVTNFTYSGSGNIAAGSVLVFNTNASNVFDYAGVITGTTLTDRSADFTFSQPFGLGTAPNITTTNGDGEQIYLMQGSFVSDGAIDLNEANYILNGVLLHGFTIKTGWVPLTSACSGTNGGGSNRQSRLPNALTCFNIESAVANTISGYYRNSVQHGPTTIRIIIRAIADVASNWVIGTSRYTIDATSNLATRAGKTFIISAGESAGQWIGDADTNWFNCSNWGRLTVPDETVDVVIDTVTSINNASISFASAFSDFYADLAVCNNLTINGRTLFIQGSPNNRLEVYGNVAIAAAGTLDMNDSANGTPDGQLYLYGNWTNNGTETNFDQGESTVHFKGSNPQIINNVAPRGTELFYNVVLDNDFNTATSNDLIATGDLTVNATRRLTIDGSGYVFAYKRLDHNGDIVIDNNGQFIQVDETDSNIGNYTGTKFQLTRTAQAKSLDYVYWSSPTENFAVSNLPNNYRYQWNTLNNNGNGTLGNWVNAAGTMTKGRGYIARASNGSATAVPLNTVFTGKPHNGQFNYQIFRGNYTGADYDADLTNATNLPTTAFDDNWNLVGNPYPSAIDAMEFINLNTATNNVKMVGAIWIWKHGINPSSNVSPFYQNFALNYSPNDYIKFNAMGSSEPTMFTNGKIASGQGFMINMSDELSPGVPNPSGSTITFTNGLRTGPSDAVYDNTDFFRPSNATVGQPEERHRIWLDIVNTTSGDMDRTLLGYATNATLGVDNLYDCFTRPKSEISLYSLIDNKPYAIQGRALPFDTEDRVPMGINVVQSGNHTVAINTVDGLFLQNQDIYLEDKVLNIIHDLKQAPYNFTSAVGTYNDRFVLRYTTAALNTQNFDTIDSSVVVAANEGQIAIKSVNELLLDVTVYDVLGRQLLSKTKIELNDLVLNSISARNQALIVKIKLANGTIITRKVVL